MNWTAPTLRWPLTRLVHCSPAVCQWFLQNGLQFNADKSEVIFLGTAAELQSAANNSTVNIVGCRLQCFSMRVLFDFESKNVI